MGKMKIEKMLNSKVLFPRTEKSQNCSYNSKAVCNDLRNLHQKGDTKKEFTNILTQIPLNICYMVNSYVTKELFVLDD